MNHTLPDLEALVDPLLLKRIPYAEMDCWALCRYLYREGFDEELDESPALAWRYVEEIWWQGDSADPLVVSQPWDLWIMRGLGMASHHTGIVVNSMNLLHTGKKTGPCQASLRRWQPRLLQIARLRRLA